MIFATPRRLALLIFASFHLKEFFVNDMAREKCILMDEGGDDDELYNESVYEVCSGVHSKYTCRKLLSKIIF